jgi:hypothetical protein
MRREEPCESRSSRMASAEWLARKVDALVFDKGELLGVTRAAAVLGLERSTVVAVLGAPKLEESPRKASPKRFMIFEAIRDNPNMSTSEISALTGVKVNYVRKVARALKQNGGTGR